MKRIQLILAYEGTRYAGWQLQATRPHPPTIQGEIEKILAKMAHERIVVHGAGRTDAGVHAEAQVCHFMAPDTMEGYDFKRILNANLPFDIRVKEATAVSPSFHARKSALRKKYGYTLWSAKDKATPRLALFSWSTPLLDFDAMNEAAQFLCGTHDFASFQNSGTPRSTTVRTIFSITAHHGKAAALTCPATWPVVTYIVEGDGFLRQMVRNIMGLLVWVGQKKIAPQDVPSLIAACNRQDLPSPAAPAQGLTLLEIEYPDFTAR